MKVYKTTKQHHNAFNKTLLGVSGGFLRPVGHATETIIYLNGTYMGKCYDITWNEINLFHNALGHQTEDLKDRPLW